MKVVMIRKLATLLVIAPIVLLASCARYEIADPPFDVDYDRWKVDSEVANQLADTEWWKEFGDPHLNKLIEVGLSQNNDLKIAAARIRRFQGLQKVASANLFPEIGYDLQAGKRQRSQDDELRPLSRDSRTRSLYGSNLNIGWEIDIWGRLDLQRTAVEHDMLAVSQVRRGLVVILVSELVEGYMQLLALDEELAIINETLAKRKQYEKQFGEKFDGGQISQMELAQVNESVLELEIRLPMLQEQISIEENSLSMLLGEKPGKIDRASRISDVNVPFPTVSVALLERRPDVEEARHKFKSASARHQISELAYLPSLSIMGIVGYASTHMSELVSGATGQWVASGLFAGPLYDAGRRKAKIAIADASVTAALENYVLVVLRAIQEVDNALNSESTARKLKEIQKRHVSVLEIYSDQARMRYDSNYSDYLTVLDADRRLIRTQVGQLKSNLKQAQAAILLYRAMAGGWIDHVNTGDLEASDGQATVVPIAVPPVGMIKEEIIKFDKPLNWFRPLLESETERSLTKSSKEKVTRNIKNSLAGIFQVPE